MCIIISGTKNKPSLVELLAAEDTNPDGGGMAWVTRKGVQIRKGLTADEIHERLGQLPKATRWVVHFRFATIGEPQVALCHPFPIEKDTGLDAEALVDRALFHNGTVSDWKDRLKDITLDPKFETKIPAGDWSDSRGVAWLLALNGSTRALHFIEGKFIVISRQGIQVYPKSLRGWTAEDGILYSNTYWRAHIPAVVVDMEPEERQETLPLLVGRRGTSFGRSLVDEALALLGEDEEVSDEEAEARAMDLPFPVSLADERAAARKKRNAKKPKAKKSRPVRRGLKLGQRR